MILCFFVFLVSAALFFASGFFAHRTLAAYKKDIMKREDDK
jgi:hypothetical protein